MMYNVSANQLPQPYNNPNDDFKFLCFINYYSETEKTSEQQEASTSQYGIFVRPRACSRSHAPLNRSLLLLERLPRRLKTAFHSQHSDQIH